MRRAAIITAVRTPIGRYGGGLSAVRPDDLAAHVIKELIARSGLDPALIDDVWFGAANQAGEDNRNVARMASLLAGLPESVPGATVNRLCASGLDAINVAARMIEAGHGDVMIAGGVESMSRAPFVMGKNADKAYGRQRRPMSTTPRSAGASRTPRSRSCTIRISMGETAENVARQYKRHARGTGSLRARGASRNGRQRTNSVPLRRRDCVPVLVPQRKGDPIEFDDRRTSASRVRRLESLAQTASRSSRRTTSAR